MEHWKVYREEKSLAGVNQMNNRLNCTLLRASPAMTEITGLNSSIKGVHLCELLTASQTAFFFCLVIMYNFVMPKIYSLKVYIEI